MVWLWQRAHPCVCRLPQPCTRLCAGCRNHAQARPTPASGQPCVGPDRERRRLFSKRHWCEVMRPAVRAGLSGRLESGGYPGGAVEQVAEGVEFADLPFGGGGQVGLDDGEFCPAVEGAPDTEPACQPRRRSVDHPPRGDRQLRPETSPVPRRPSACRDRKRPPGPAPWSG
jgi:hypothetical protein